MASSSLDVEVHASSDLWRGHENYLTKALSAAAAEEGVSGGVSLLLADDAALATLNAQFRGKQGPTNVLSFPPAAEGSETGFLGDIALAAETIVEQANFQGKRFEHHAAHLAVHGFLHLLGYDHESSTDAAKMEARECAILQILGIEDPYA